MVGGGSGTPGPKVAIPGVYTGNEPGILINIYVRAIHPPRCRPLLTRDSTVPRTSNIHHAWPCKYFLQPLRELTDLVLPDRLSGRVERVCLTSQLRSECIFRVCEEELSDRIYLILGHDYHVYIHFPSK